MLGAVVVFAHVLGEFGGGSRDLSQWTEFEQRANCARFGGVFSRAGRRNSVESWPTRRERQRAFNASARFAGRLGARLTGQRFRGRRAHSAGGLQTRPGQAQTGGAKRAGGRGDASPRIREPLFRPLTTNLYFSLPAESAGRSGQNTIGARRSRQAGSNGARGRTRRAKREQLRRRPLRFLVSHRLCRQRLHFLAALEEERIWRFRRPNSATKCSTC